MELDQRYARIKRIEGLFFAQRLLQTTHSIEKAKKAAKYDVLSGSDEALYIARCMNSLHRRIFRGEVVTLLKGQRRPVRDRRCYRKNLFHQSLKDFLANSLWQYVLRNGAMQ